MENGDIGAFHNRYIIVVLEGVLVEPKYVDEKPIRRLLSGAPLVSRYAPERELAPPFSWDWKTFSLKCIQRYGYNNVPVEVITFLGEDVRDAASQWFTQYDLQVRDVEFSDFNMFCESLKWRSLTHVERIVDSDEGRLIQYGQLGYRTTFGGQF